MIPTGQMRRMTEADLPRVLDIEQAACEVPWTPGIFRDCLNVGYLCWVYSEDEVIVGYGVLSVGAGEAHVLTLGVDPAAQGRGIGRRLLTYMLDQSRRLGADTGLLEVRASNKRALSLYVRMGFVEVGVRRDYYETATGREDAVVMALTLTTSNADQFVPKDPGAI